jgi:hypothetical protein
MIPPLSGHYTNANGNIAFATKGANDNDARVAVAA